MPRHPHPHIEEILDRNAARVIAHYEERHIRREYFAQHPFHYIYVGCMDGRTSHLPQTFGIPVGCAEFFQTGGAMFDIGWKYFSNLLTESIQFGLTKKRTVVILVSSHFSGHYPNHGCRAFENDRRAARTYVLRLARDIRYAVEPYGGDVHVLPIEFDTDDDSVILYGETGRVDTSHFLSSECGLKEVLYDSFPSYVDSDMGEELHTLVHNNIEHVHSVLRNRRDHTACSHCETTLLVGRGAGTWLNPHRNAGIILFPEGERLDTFIVTAGKILQSNANRDKILQKHGAVIMPCSAYGDRRNERFAIARVKAYQQIIERLFAQHLPDLHYTLFPATVDLTTWQLTALG